jgi:hypothetical protein
MVKNFGIEIDRAVQSDAWCSDVVSLNPACRWCVEGVMYWSVPISIPQNLILDFKQIYTSDRPKKTLKLLKIEEIEGRQH